jgi:hypothetical protein
MGLGRRSRPVDRRGRSRPNPRRAAVEHQHPKKDIFRAHLDASLRHGTRSPVTTGRSARKIAAESPARGGRTPTPKERYFPSPSRILYLRTPMKRVLRTYHHPRDLWCAPAWTRGRRRTTTGAGARASVARAGECRRSTRRRLTSVAREREDEPVRRSARSRERASERTTEDGGDPWNRARERARGVR